MDFDELIIIYVKYHIKNNYDYSILSSGVAIYVLKCLYKKSLKEGEAQELSTISEQKKEIYKEMADKYSTEKRDRLQVYMACYALDYITNNIN